MGTKPKRPRDANQLAKLIVDLSTGEVQEPMPSKKAKSGRVGGLKGGKSRMAGLSDEERVQLAKKAAAARWGEKPVPSRKGTGKSD